MSVNDGRTSYGAEMGGHNDGPTFSSLDIMAGIVAAAMILLPLTAGATHYSKVGWENAQTSGSR